MQSVILAQRPPISIPQSTVSPALLEELTNEICTLAAVYHKPTEAFIGRGRLGADELGRKGHAAAMEAEGSMSGEGAIAALQTVAQGQRSENLLDFGLDDDVGEVNTLGAAVQQAALNGLAMGGAAKAAPVTKPDANPMDDLMSLFDSAGLGSAASALPAAMPARPTQNGRSADPFGGLNFGGASQTSSPSPAQPSQPKRTDDLMGDLF